MTSPLAGQTCCPFALSVTLYMKNVSKHCPAHTQSCFPKSKRRVRPRDQMRAMRRKQSCQLVSDSPEQSQQLGCTWLTMQSQETINNKHCAKQTYHACLRKTWPVKAPTPHSGASELGSAMSKSLHRQRLTYTKRACRLAAHQCLCVSCGRITYLTSQRCKDVKDLLDQLLADSVLKRVLKSFGYLFGPLLLQHC